jgi:hypothetical protein
MAPWLAPRSYHLPTMFNSVMVRRQPSLTGPIDGARFWVERSQLASCCVFGPQSVCSHVCSHQLVSLCRNPTPGPPGAGAISDTSIRSYLRTVANDDSIMTTSVPEKDAGWFPAVSSTRRKELSTQNDKKPSELFVCRRKSVSDHNIPGVRLSHEAKLGPNTGFSRACNTPRTAGPPKRDSS